MAGDTCDVCGQPSAGVACSALGAISFAYCEKCLRIGAEPLVAFETTAWTCHNNVHNGVRALSTYVDGQYIRWDDWYAKYGEECIRKCDAEYAEYCLKEQAMPLFVQCEIAGNQFAPGKPQHIRESGHLELVPEPENRYHDNAQRIDHVVPATDAAPEVRVKMGYVPRAHADTMANLIAQGNEFAVVPGVAGGLAIDILMNPDAAELGTDPAGPPEGDTGSSPPSDGGDNAA